MPKFLKDKAVVFCVFITLLLCFLPSLVAGMDIISKRLSDKTLQRTPYAYAANVSLASVDYVVPVGVRICELRAKAAGTIKVKLRRGAIATLFATDYDIFSVDMASTTSRIYKTGTSADSITVFGVYVDELNTVP